VPAAYLSPDRWHGAITIPTPLAVTSSEQRQRQWPQQQQRQRQGQQGARRPHQFEPADRKTRKSRITSKQL